jgi:putative hydrolase of the HAD superfamily
MAAPPSVSIPAAMSEPARRVPVWLFDLDNTLHDANPHIFPHINHGMTAYLERHLALTRAAADALRQHYWRRYGATLLGLIRHHATDPRHFLAETHRFDALREMMVFERALKAMLRQLPGRKIVFSNAPCAYIETVLETMGIRVLFEAVTGIEALGFRPKPDIAAYRRLIRLHRLDPRHCIMIEDTAVNLAPARRLGMRTVLVGHGTRRPAYVDIRIGSILRLPRTFPRPGAS